MPWRDSLFLRVRCIRRAETYIPSPTIGKPVETSRSAITTERVLTWVAVKELEGNCYCEETFLFTIYPYYGNLM